jgi:hypothetical protein
MKNPSSSVHEAAALRRLSLVQHILDLVHQHWPLSAALEEVAASHPLPGEPDAPPAFVAKRTLEDWYYAFKKGGFDALKPKSRSDRGKPRRLSSEQQQWILERVRSFPGVPVKLLYRQWRQADPTLPALSAVYRWLEQNDLDAQGRRYLLRQSIPGPTKSFEAPGVNDLWIVDFSPGPFLALAPKTVATHLCLLIDDHSRLIPFAAYGLAADTQALLGCLKQAIRRRGLPRKLYADNGGPFVNHHLKIVCANLGIRLAIGGIQEIHGVADEIPVRAFNVIAGSGLLLYRFLVRLVDLGDDFEVRPEIKLLGQRVGDQPAMTEARLHGLENIAPHLNQILHFHLVRVQPGSFQSTRSPVDGVRLGQTPLQRAIEVVHRASLGQRLQQARFLAHVAGDEYRERRGA